MMTEILTYSLGSLVLLNLMALALFLLSRDTGGGNDTGGGGRGRAPIQPEPPPLKRRANPGWTGGRIHPACRSVGRPSAFARRTRRLPGYQTQGRGGYTF